MAIWDSAPAPLQACRTPEKLKFPSREQAERKIVRLHMLKVLTPLAVYECPCGWFHLTTARRQ